MTVLDTTIVNVAMPRMMTGLHASIDQILWVLNAYTVVYAVLLITGGRLGDIYGLKRLFAAGLALFTLASVLSGLSQTSGQLIAARALQAVGGALMAPQVLAAATALFPPQRSGGAIGCGMWGATVGLAGVAGPTLGGLIVTSLSWRWIFFVNVPVGLLTLAAVLAIVPDLRPDRRHHLDGVGVLLATAGSLAVVYGLIEGQRFRWGAITGALTIPEAMAGGAALPVGFVAWERLQHEPLLPLTLFKDRNFSLMSVATAASAFSILGLFFPFTIYLQTVLGVDPLAAGLAIAPFAVTTFVVSPLGGRLADRIGGK